MDEEALLDLEVFDALGVFSLLVAAAEVFTGFPDLFAPPSELAPVEAVATVGLLDAIVFWGRVWVLGLTCTSQGGGALLYDGTILKVTDPRASRCNNRRGPILQKLRLRVSKLMHQSHKQKIFRVMTEAYRFIRH